jgi:peptidoglycan/LPS O-acetylase OafA/YrhL
LLPKRKHYPALDGLRGIAILLVVFYHNFGFIKYFFFGWIGVDLFFVLSGFLITDILLNTVNSPGYFKNFYAKRVLRIFPLYYLSLIIFLILFPAIKTFPLDFGFYVNHQWWFWTYLQNWFLIFHDVGNSTTAIQHYWSLAVEEQFYIVWPLVIFLIRKPKWLLVIAGSLLAAVIFTRFYLWEIKVKDLNYFGLYTYTRIDGICIGSILAILQFMKSAFIKNYFTGLVLFMAAINFVFYFINRQFSFTYPYLAIVGYTTFAMLFAIAVHEVVTGENKFFNWLLNIGVLRFFGKISYGLYVFHWPVYLILYGWMEENVKSFLHLPVGMLETVVSALLTLTGILISIISFYTFENYFLKKKKVFN